VFYKSKSPQLSSFLVLSSSTVCPVAAVVPLPSTPKITVLDQARLQAISEIYFQIISHCFWQSNQKLQFIPSLITCIYCSTPYFAMCLFWDQTQPQSMADNAAILDNMTGGVFGGSFAIVIIAVAVFVVSRKVKFLQVSHGGEW
jgi:hypothetical protein